jgi:hypothetical protein
MCTRFPTQVVKPIGEEGAGHLIAFWLTSKAMARIRCTHMRTKPLVALKPVRPALLRCEPRRPCRVAKYGLHSLQVWRHMKLICLAFAARLRWPAVFGGVWGVCLALAGCGDMAVRPVAAAGAAPASIETPFVTTTDLALEAALLEAHPGYTRRLVAAAGTSGPARYVHGRVDLSGDGRAEVVVFVMGPDFCNAAGCALMVFSQEAGRYTLIHEFAGSRPPLIALPTRSRGWADLLRIDSGGGRSPIYVRHAFDGKSYVEVERIPIGATSPAGSRLLVGELGNNVGAVLAPRE